MKIKLLTLTLLTSSLLRFTGVAQVSPAYQKDLSVVRQSQEHALDLAEAMEKRAQDARAKALVQSVKQEIEKALRHLSEASNSPALLAEAVAAEQAAYQALLKLSAHEYQVSKSKKGQKGQSSAQQPNQRQLDQLDLKQSENQYETQRQATLQQSAEQREQLQILSRLKELAQRQQDLNDRLKEMQTALQEAKTEQEREEIRRRLKRLREEEKEMLADVDELRQRMDRPENQSRMTEARQQLDETRSKVQQATEALDKESVPEALASGTRAQRDLQQLRDDLRKKNSSQFTEQMRQMRSEARGLAQKEEEIGKKLDSLADNKRKTLSDSDESKMLAGQLKQQKTTMTNLLENMRNVSEQAEAAEPLLSKQLYDTVRKASQDDAKTIKDTTDDLLRSGALSRNLYDKLKAIEDQKGSKALEVTSELLDQKMLPQASQAEQRARKGIDELKRGVERAAESILGDDTEALRVAKRELDDLARQLDKEIAQSDPSGESEGKGKQNDPAQARESGQQPSPSKTDPASSQTEAETAQDSQKDNQQRQQGQTPGDQSGKEQDPTRQASKGEKGNQKGGRSEKEGSQGQGSQPGQSNSQNAKGQPDPSEEQKQTQGKGQGQGQQGQGQQGQGQQGQGQQGQGQQGQGQPQGENAQQPPADNQSQQAGQGKAPGGGGRGGRPGLQNLLGGNIEGGGGGSVNRPDGPLTGEDFSAWSDRLRDVEEMIDLQDVRSEVARVRGRARAMHLDAKQKGQKPDWAVVRLQIAHPLAEVRQKINEELARRQSQEALVPIDRDPVPSKFTDLVRKYYENLGRGAE